MINEFIYAQSYHLLVVSSCRVPQNTHNMNTMWHSIKYTCQSKYISGDFFVSYIALCPR